MAHSAPLPGTVWWPSSFLAPSPRGAPLASAYAAAAERSSRSVGLPDASALAPRAPIALIALNVAPRQLDYGAEVLHRLWRLADVTIAADGAANRLREADAALPAAAQRVPGHLTGDMDSIEPAALEHFRARGSSVAVDASQDRHDFDKCLRLLESLEGGRFAEATVFVLGSVGGRVDHGAATLSTLCRHPHLRIVLLSNCNTSVLLSPGSHTILHDPELETGTCGLLPLFGRCTVSTTGFRWNLEGGELAMDGMCSSSNQAEPAAAGQPHVLTVDAHGPLLWTMELIDLGL